MTRSPGSAEGPTPDRSVLFIALAAEESGLLSDHRRQPAAPLATTAAVVNMEMGPDGPTCISAGLGKSRWSVT